LLELRENLKVKEKEKEIYLSHLNMSSTDPRYGAKLLEQQSDQIADLKMQKEELERRQTTCEKKWGDLLDENQRNAEAVIQLQ
jgi:hypothetical protein